MATADGIVIKVETDKYLGKNVTISHGNGFTTVYGHMSNFNVKAGQRVKRRDIIGYIGQTGKAAGPHVHYEVFRDGKRVDPRNFPARRIGRRPCRPVASDITRIDRRGRGSFPREKACGRTWSPRPSGRTSSMR
ncbi:MAG: M23 family metallopeptidase [Candidatus Moduliflexus flocculans]|nr:M23 family metallopeptidase [Candidatus Moduliflexus flocculans]